MFGGDAGLVKSMEETYKEVQEELGKLVEQKQLLQMEEKVKKRVREKI